MGHQHTYIKSLNNDAFEALNIKDQKLIIAGPCAIESEESLLEVANFLKSIGINFLRAGAYKPRTSVHSFQGLGDEGLAILKRVKELTGMKVVTEIPDPSYIEKFDFVDIIQVGARNMQNFSLLKALGKTTKPVLLKRGFGNTIDEMLSAAEYIISEGNKNVILCERGIKTFETSTRNTLDLASVAIIKEYYKIPIIVDPSHAAGRADIIPALSRASMASGADGLIIEVHQQPAYSISDSSQALDFNTFKSLYNELF